MAKQATNAVVLNHSTDGVSCESKWNFDTTCNYLAGTTNVISMPNPNHDNKNTRGQLCSGSSASSIGMHVVDPYLFKQAGVAKHLVRIDDYASDAVVLGLASYKVVKALFEMNSPDVGNLHVSTYHYLF